mmetsp:Transcript_156414/g.272143  ORF Transcript_156414/g.272143 Transcript_156414/m.272143 type:complete len:134 (-) Transcript_156414:8-409(-)
MMRLSHHCHCHHRNDNDIIGTCHRTSCRPWCHRLQLVPNHVGWEGKDLKIRLAEEQEGKSSHQLQSVSFFQEARVPLTIITLGLLDLFSSQAWFNFATSFEIGPEGHLLRAQWPLGLFLEECGLNTRQTQSKL